MEVLILIVIVAGLSGILFVALQRLINNITTQAQEYYFKKIQNFDAKLLEKQQELQNLESKKENENIENKDRVIEKNLLDKDLLNVMNSTEYASANALKIANQVDEIFQIDEETIIKKFLSKTTFNEDIQTYEMLQDRFSPNFVYKLKMLDKENQIKAIKNILSDKEYIIFNSYISTRKFKLEKFLLDLDILIENNKPLIEIIVGNKKQNYNYLSPYIKTTYSDDVYKGIIIKYQDRIYDYSINERDV